MAWWSRLLSEAPTPEDTAARLAGRAMAYAALNLSDMPDGAVLTPFASVMRGFGDPRHAREEMVRFAADTQDVAVAAARAHLAAEEASSSGWGFAREATMRDADGGAHDVVMAEGWAPGLTRPVSLVQRFRPAGAPGGFALLGQPVVEVEGAIRSDDEARRFADMAEDAARRFEDHWDRWRAAGTA